jgi:hypothetical protein
MPPRQSELPGTEAPRCKDIEEAAEAYTSVRDKRMALTTKEVEAQNALVLVMQKHAKDLDTDAKGNPCYRFEGEICRLNPGKAKVSVRSEKSDDDSDEDE